MRSTVDILEERAAAAAELIASLRLKIQSLERELRLAHEKPLSRQPAPDPSLAEELERLRQERIVVRQSIRGLLREIDRVS
jgi:FtsZ-binding cell division protein ZapB